MTTHIHNWTNASIGIAGWLIANARMYIQNMNEKSSSITVQGVTIPAGEGKAFMRGTSAWYPISP